MKKLEEFIAKLGDDAQQNIDLILKEIDKNVKSVKNIAYTYELSKLLVAECLKKDIKNKEKYVNLANFHREKYVQYLTEKLNICYGNRDWFGVLFYAETALEVLQTPHSIKGLNLYEFSSYDDFYMYTHINPDEKFRWVQFKDAFFLFRKAMAYKNLEIYDQALENFVLCRQYDPMSFSVFVEMIDLYYKQQNYDKMMSTIREAYEFAYTNVHMAILLNYQSQYFLSKKNIITAKCCLVLSLRFDPSVRNNNIVQNFVCNISDIDDNITLLESIDYVFDKLKEDGAMFKVQQHLVKALSLYYSELLRDKKTPQAKKAEIKNILTKIADKNVIDIIEYEVLKKLTLIVNKKANIRFSIPNSFLLENLEGYNNGNLNVIVQASDHNKILEITYLKMPEMQFDEMVDCFIKYNQSPEIKFEKIGRVTFINKIDVIKTKTRFMQDTIILTYFFQLPTKELALIKLNCTMHNQNECEKILNSIVSSIEELE